MEQSRIQAGSQLADQIVQAVDIREAVASPETFLQVFRSISERFTPEQVLEATQEMFTGDVVRAIMLTPDPLGGETAQLRAALERPAVASADARDDAEAIDFADLPPVGEPTLPSLREPLGILDVERLEFDNGVRALLYSGDNEPGRVTVRVRFGAGWRGFEDDEAAYAHLAPMALINSGVGPLDQNDLDRAAAGSKLGFDFDIEDGAFVFEGRTRQEDLAAQLYLFAAKLQNPGWDPAPVRKSQGQRAAGLRCLQPRSQWRARTVISTGCCATVIRVL